jgi:hypothetical protein
MAHKGVTIEFGELKPLEVDLINAHPLALGSAQPVRALPLWRCDFRIDPPLEATDVASDIHWWAMSVGIPYRKMVGQ